MKDSTSSDVEQGSAAARTSTRRPRAPRELAMRSYDRGRQDARRDLAEEIGDLVALGFLDGCAFAGADTDEIDLERGRRALLIRRAVITRMRRRAVRPQERLKAEDGSSPA